MPSSKKSLHKAINSVEIHQSTVVRQGGGFLINIQDLRAGFKAHSLVSSFAYAMQGLAYAAKTQRNFRIHLGLASLSLVLAYALKLSLFEWSIICGVIGLVLFAELINTALELFVDMLTEGRYDLRAKAIKDMAAGAVLVTSISAFVCGLCIFAPHILRFFSLG